MRKLFTLFLAVLMLSSVLLTGCGGFVYEEGVHYSKQFVDEGFDTISGKETESVYNKDLFYRNDVTVTTADPFVFRCTDATDTENYGTYYLYGTTTMGVFNCYSSLDLVSWKPKSGAYIWNPNGWQSSTCWAPEVVWDEFANPSDYNLENDGMGKGVYFLFASSDAWQNYNKGGALNRVMDMAVSVSPYGPFYQWEGVETGAVINGVDYGKEANYATKTLYAEDYEADPDNYTGYVGREDNEVTIDDPWWNAPAAMASLSYQWENKALAGQVGEDGKIVNPNAAYLISDEGSGWFDCIDPHPYLDYNNMVEVNGVIQPKKYLFFTRRGGSANASAVVSGKLVFLGSTVYAVSFINNDWAQIDYSSLSRISGTNYNFISQAAADAYKAQAQAFDASQYPLGYQEVASDGTILNEYASFTYGNSTTEAYVDSSNGINEGAQLWYNEDTGLYYLTVSISAYTTASYSVITLVAYDIMGPYRKLELEEGGLTLGANGGLSMDNVTGPGHHTIFKCGEELLMMYHKHKDLTVSIYTRGYCVDRIEWVKNQAGMTIMHVNGPTTSIQPKFYGTGTTPYTNIANEAEVSVKGDDYNDVKYLTDNVIPIHNEFVSPHVFEFEFTSDKAVITLKFEDYRHIKALMIYNSKEMDKSFIDIEEIEMKAKIDGKKGTVKIENLEFYWDLCQFTNGDRLRPGGAATAAFDEISVKEIKITVLNPNQDISGITAISEIYVLGRPIA